MFLAKNENNGLSDPNQVFFTENCVQLNKLITIHNYDSVNLRQYLWSGFITSLR